MAGTLSAAIAIGQATEPQFVGTGALAVAINELYAQVAGVSGAGVLDALFKPQFAQAAALAGSGTLAPGLVQKYPLGIGLSGAGALGATADGSVVGGTAVTRIATGAGNRATGASASLATSFSCNAATSDMNTFAVVGVVQSVSTSSTATSCTVTYGGVAMLQVAAIALVGTTTNRGAISLFFLQNPPTGAQTVVATSGGASTKTAIAAQAAVYKDTAGPSWLSVANGLNINQAVLADGMAFNCVGNGAAITSPNQNSLYLAGSLVTGLMDYISVQDGDEASGAVAFTNAGTATTPRARSVALNPIAPKFDTLTDSFATKDTAKWSWDGGATVTSGQAVIPCNSTYADSFGTYEIAVYDLTGSEIHMEVVQRPNVGAGTTEGYLELQAAGPLNLLSMAVTGPDIVMRETVSGVASDTTVTYNATNHRWWRIRESGGTVYWDTAPDNGSGAPGTWTNRRSKTLGIPVTGLAPFIYAGYYGTETTPGSFIIDNINLP